MVLLSDRKIGCCSRGRIRGEGGQVVSEGGRWGETTVSTVVPDEAVS